MGLKEKEVRIEEDLTWEEKKINWNARKVARKRGWRKTKVRIEQGGVDWKGMVVIG